MIQVLFQPMLEIQDISAEDDSFTIKAIGGGFFAKLLALASKVSLSVDSSGCRLKKATFSGEELTFIPRQHMASTFWASRKPVELLVSGISMMLVGLLNVALMRGELFPGGVLLVVGVVLLLAYLFSKRRILIGIVSAGGTVEAMKLKASESSLSELKEGMLFVNQLLPSSAVAAPASSASSAPASTSRSSESPSFGRSSKPFSASPPPPPPPSGDGGTHIISCPQCSTQMSVTDATLGKKVRCVSCKEVFRVEAP